MYGHGPGKGTASEIAERVRPDPMMHQLQMTMFMKNMAMLGGALLITQFGSGPWSLDSRRK